MLLVAQRPLKYAPSSQNPCALHFPAFDAFKQECFYDVPHE
jgi:hypothetical protein